MTKFTGCGAINYRLPYLAGWNDDRRVVETDSTQSRLWLKYGRWLLFPLALGLAVVITPFLTPVRFDLGDKSIALTVQKITPGGPFADQGFLVSIGWDGPTGSFSHGNIFGVKLGARLLRLEIMEDPMAAARKRLPTTIDGLIACLDSKDHWIKLTALQGLGDAGEASSPAIPALLDMVGNGDALAESTLATICKAAGDRSVHPLLKGLRSPDALLRAKSAEILGDIGPAAAAGLPALTASLDDSDPKVVIYSAMAVHRIEGPTDRAVKALTTLLADPQPDIRSGAAFALGEFGPKATAAVPGLHRCLDDTNVQVRGMAARSLGLIGPMTRQIGTASESVTTNTTAISRLEQMAMSEGDSNLWALDGLSSLGPDAAPVVAKIYMSANGQRRLAGARALMKLGSDAADVVPMLMADLDGTNAGRAHLTAQIIGHLGEKARVALPQLRELLSHPDVRVRIRASEAIWRLDGSTEVALTVLKAALQDQSIHRGGAIRFATEALGDMGPAARDAVPLLEALLTDNQTGVSQAAAGALKKIAN